MTATHEAGTPPDHLVLERLSSSAGLFPGLTRLGDGGGLRFGRIASGPIPAARPGILREATVAAYSRILGHVSEAGLRLVRIWNRIPHIGRHAGAGLDMYMVFGEGRYEAFAAHHGAGFEPAAELPASTGIGADDDRLRVDFVAAPGPARHVRNSRQIDAYAYSPRYGPRPPCFARGTIWESPGGGTTFFLAGTASILGEATVHAGDLARQVDQTIDNLRWLVGPENLAAQGIGRGFRLEEIRDLVVYHSRAGDREAIEERLSALLPRRTPRLLMRRDLCRRDMLVEIEGVVKA